MFFALYTVSALPGIAMAGPPPSPELARHLDAIAKLASPSPAITIPEGPFLMGSIRIDDDPSTVVSPSSQFLEQEASALIRPDHTAQISATAERENVVEHIGCAAQFERLGLNMDHRHRCLG